MSSRDSRSEKSSRRKLLRRLFEASLVCIFLFLFSIFLMWLIFRPAVPQIRLQRSLFLVKQLNDTSGFPISPGLPVLGNFTNNTLVVSFYFHNPNARVGVLYDQINAYAKSGRSNITNTSSLINATHQGPRETIAMNATLHVDPGWTFDRQKNAAVVRVDDQVVVKLKVRGRFRWKFGGWVTGKYRIKKRCVAEIKIVVYNLTSSFVGIGQQVSPAECDDEE